MAGCQQGSSHSKDCWGAVLRQPFSLLSSKHSCLLKITLVGLKFRLQISEFSMLPTSPVQAHHCSTLLPSMFSFFQQAKTTINCTLYTVQYTLLSYPIFNHYHHRNSPPHPHHHHENPTIIRIIIMTWPNTYPSCWPHTTQVLRDTRPNSLLLHNYYHRPQDYLSYLFHQHHIDLTISA